MYTFNNLLNKLNTKKLIFIKDRNLLIEKYKKSRIIVD